MDSYEIYGSKALDVAYRTALATKHITLLESILTQAKEGISPIILPDNLTEDEIHCLAVHYIYPEDNKIFLGTRASKKRKTQLAELPWD